MQSAWKTWSQPGRRRRVSLSSSNSVMQTAHSSAPFQIFKSMAAAYSKVGSAAMTARSSPRQSVRTGSQCGRFGTGRVVDTAGDVEDKECQEEGGYDGHDDGGDGVVEAAEETEVYVGKSMIVIILNRQKKTNNFESLP